MPYISVNDRMWYEPQLKKLCNFLIRGQPGHLNYLITSLVRSYLGDHPRYADYNEVLGALEAAKLELYRRMVAPYENAKIAENGDVYK